MACRCARCSLWAALHRKSISCTLTRSVLHACASAGRHTHTCVHARTCPCMHNSHAHTGTHASIRAHAMRSAWPLGVRSYVPCLLLFSLPPFPSFPPFLSSPLSSSLPQFSPPLPFPLLSTATVRAFGFGTSESSRRARACGVQVSRPPAERDRGDGDGGWENQGVSAESEGHARPQGGRPRGICAGNKAGRSEAKEACVCADAGCAQAKVPRLGHLPIFSSARVVRFRLLSPSLVAQVCFPCRCVLAGCVYSRAHASIEFVRARRWSQGQQGCASSARSSPRGCRCARGRWICVRRTLCLCLCVNVYD